jgi:hypothetical protein
MKNLKKFENFGGFAADEEMDQMNNDQIYADRDAQDEHDTHDAQYSQNDEEPVDVLARFEEEFGDNEPSNQEVMEFYHKLRSEGVDGIEIFDTLLSNNKIGEGDDENYSDDDDNYDPEHDEDFGAMRADGSDDLGYDDEEEGQEDQHFEGLKKFFEFNDIQEDEEGFDEFGNYDGLDKNQRKKRMQEDEEERQVQVDEEGFDEFGNYIGFSDSNYDKININPNIVRKGKEGQEDAQQYERRSLKRFNNFK